MVKNFENLKNYKYKFLFGSKIPRQLVMLLLLFLLYLCMFSMLWTMMLFLLVLLYLCMCLLLWILNVLFWIPWTKPWITKKRKKVYELNKHFQNIEVMKVFRMEYFPHFASKVVQVQCNVCTQIEGKHKLLVP
jgi:hypothetical protein